MRSLAVRKDCRVGVLGEKSIVALVWESVIDIGYGTGTLEWASSATFMRMSGGTLV